MTRQLVKRIDGDPGLSRKTGTVVDNKPPGIDIFRLHPAGNCLATFLQGTGFSLDENRIVCVVQLRNSLFNPQHLRTAADYQGVFRDADLVTSRSLVDQSTDRLF